MTRVLVRAVPILALAYQARVSFIDAEYLYALVMSAAAFLLAWLEHKGAREDRQDDRALVHDLLAQVRVQGERIARLEAMVASYDFSDDG